MSGQLNVRRNRGATRNQITAGGAFDRSTVGFMQSTQIGYLRPDRSVTPQTRSPTASRAAASTARRSTTAPISTASSGRRACSRRHDVAGRHLARHAVGTFQPDRRREPRSHHASRRHRVPDGDHTFSRFNPAAGVTVQPAPGVNLYAGYSEGSRAPTSIELGCADPAVALQAAERAGRRSAARSGRDADDGRRRPRRTRRFSWNAGVFRADQRERPALCRRPRRPASATSRTSARRAARASSSARTCAAAA